MRSYAVVRLQCELIGLVMLLSGIAGVFLSFYLGFWNVISAGCWITALVPFLLCRPLAEVGIWTATVTLVVAHAVGAMCALYALAGIFFGPVALWELAVYAPRAPERLTEGAFLFAAGYALPGAFWLRIFLS